MSNNMEKNQNSFDQLLKKFNQMTKIQIGQIINGTVLYTDTINKFVVFDIYSKSENRVPIKEFEKTPEQGDVYPLYVVSLDSQGQPLLSFKKAKKETRKKELIEMMKNKTIVEGYITGKNYNTPAGGSYNGYRVNLNDIFGFLPKSQIHGFQRIKDKENFDQEKFEFLVTNIDDSRDTINLVMLDDNIKKYNFNDTQGSKIRERDIVEGEVISIEDYGCYLLIDNNYLGFIKINDLSSNKRVENPSEIVSIGEKIKVKVIKVEPNRFKCSLSILDHQNIENIQSRFKIGEIYDAKITSIINNGFYVVLDDGLPLEPGVKKKRIDGFIESSEVSWNEADFYNNKFKVGDLIKMKVLALDLIISGSCKQCDNNVFDKFCQEFKENDLVKVTINNTFKGKAIGEITLQDGSIISGLIDKRELNWDYRSAEMEFNKIKENKNTSMETKITRINKDNYCIDLSVRRTQKDPIDEFIEKYTPSATPVEAEITYITDNYILLSVDHWRNILILYKTGDSNFKLKSKIKVNVGKLDKKSKYDRHIMAYRADQPKKNKESFNNSVADNITWS